MLRSPHAEQRLGEHVGRLVHSPQHVGASFLARSPRVGGFEWRGLVHAPTTQASSTASVQRVPGQLASAQRDPNARDGGTLDRNRSARVRKPVPARRPEVIGVALRAPTPDNPNIRTCPDPFTESVRRRRGLRSHSSFHANFRGRAFNGPPKVITPGASSFSRWFAGGCALASAARTTIVFARRALRAACGAPGARPGRACPEPFRPQGLCRAIFDVDRRALPPHGHRPR